ncbi:MAG: MopE-related protein [Polyangiales bacterium]
MSPRLSLAAALALFVAAAGCDNDPYCLNCAFPDATVGPGRDVPPVPVDGADASTGPCTPTGPEVCDGRDNDCDGLVDEGLDTQNDPRNCGACGSDCAMMIRNGIPACNAGRCAIMRCDVGFIDLDNDPSNGCEYACVNTGSEVCDGVDNDCNGGVDEPFDLQSDLANCGRCGAACAFAGASAACQMGACVMGACRPGFVDLDGDPSNGCELACTPSGPEVCDGRDNDCDGQVDEGFSLMTDPMNCGACGRACVVINGTAACAMGVCGVASCNAGYVDRNGDLSDGCELACGNADGSRGAEVCDGRDNDCNGMVDDAVPGVGEACGVTRGVCRQGMRVCERGTLRCVGESGPTTELCDGLDNDCDGVVDNPPSGGSLPGTGPSATCGTNVGACTFGAFACVGGRIQCSGGTAAGTETCDGLDNDCDGQVDEGVAVPTGFRCNRRGSESQGVCATARPFCDGARGFQCTYPTTYRDLDNEALCDGLDNNCDGRVDEGCLTLSPSSDRRLDQGNANSIQPVIAGGGLNLGVAYIDRRNGVADVFFTRSTNGGSTWAADRRLDTTTSGSDSVQPAISWFNGGTDVFALWGDFRAGNYRQVWGSRSTDSGANFSSADFRVNAGQDIDSFNIRVAQATANVVAVWEGLLSSRGRHIYASYSANRGATWSAPAQVDQAPMNSVASTPDLAVVGNRVFVVWRDNRSGRATDIYFRASANGGVTWAASDLRLDTDAAGAHASEEPSVAADAAGNVYVAWQEVRDDRAYDIYFNRSNNNGATWRTADVRVDTDPFPRDSIQPTVIALPGGNASVVWQDFRFGLPNPYASRTTDGAARFLTADAQVVGGRPGQSRAETIVAAGAAGTVFAAWADDRNRSLDIYANYSLDGGATWQPTDVRLDQAPTATDSTNPSITATTNSAGAGVGHVVWVDRRANGVLGDVYYRAIGTP